MGNWRFLNSGIEPVYQHCSLLQSESLLQTLCQPDGAEETQVIFKNWVHPQKSYSISEISCLVRVQLTVKNEVLSGKGRGNCQVTGGSEVRKKTKRASVGLCDSEVNFTSCSVEPVRVVCSVCWAPSPTIHEISESQLLGK